LFDTVTSVRGHKPMENQLPVIYIARHGETGWTVSGQDTGLTDLPLTPQGERNARALAEQLDGLTFSKVFTSPLQRARRTCELTEKSNRLSPVEHPVSESVVETAM
jgi:broad specificity phosphatase PhoE